jgi:hypothetical protein
MPHTAPHLTMSTAPPTALVAPEYWEAAMLVAEFLSDSGGPYPPLLPGPASPCTRVALQTTRPPPVLPVASSIRVLAGGREPEPSWVLSAPARGSEVVLVCCTRDKALARVPAPVRTEGVDPAPEEGEPTPAVLCIATAPPPVLSAAVPISLMPVPLRWVPAAGAPAKAVGPPTAAVVPPSIT